MTRDERARPASGIRLCALDELGDPGAKGFSFRDGDFVFMGFVVRVGDEVIGYVDSCPHVGLPLATFGERYLTRAGDQILCGSHGALFRIGSGVCVAGPCVGRALTPWPVRLADGMVTTA